MKVDLGFIYCLCDPVTEIPFYVGCTTSTPKDRLAGHYQDINERERNGLHLTESQIFIKNLFPLKPLVKIIEILFNEDIFQKEIHYIKEYNKKFDLLNLTSGGLGGDTYSLRSKESKQKTSIKLKKLLTGKSKPEGFGKSMSELRKGYNNPALRFSKRGWFISKKEGDVYRLFKYGFEINFFVKNKYAGDNISSSFKNKTNNPYYGYYWSLYNEESEEVKSQALQNYMEIPK